MLFQDVRFVSASTIQPVEATLGNQIRLLGYDLVLPPSGGEWEGGKPFSLTLYWQAFHRPKDDYTVFVHVLGADGELVTQHDAPPMEGLYPTSQWSKGDIVTQQIDLRVPPDTPPGRYELLVGMYTYPDIVRLPVTSDRPHAQDGLVWLQSVEIQP